MVDIIADEINDLKNVQVITFDVIVLLAYIYHNFKNIKKHDKALKSIYKRYCEDVIKRHKLPPKLLDYVKESSKFI